MPLPSLRKTYICTNNTIDWPGTHNITNAYYSGCVPRWAVRVEKWKGYGVTGYIGMGVWVLVSVCFPCIYIYYIGIHMMCVYNGGVMADGWRLVSLARAHTHTRARALHLYGRRRLVKSDTDSDSYCCPLVRRNPYPLHPHAHREKPPPYTRPFIHRAPRGWLMCVYGALRHHI